MAARECRTSLLPGGWRLAQLRQHGLLCMDLWCCAGQGLLQALLQTLQPPKLRPLQTVLGYSDGDVLGMSCLTVCGPATDKKAMRQIIQLQRSGQAGATKVLCYRRDGSPFW